MPSAGQWGCPWTVFRRTTLPRPTASVKRTPSFSELDPFVDPHGQPKIDVSSIVLSSTRFRSPPFIHTPAAPTSWMWQALTVQSEDKTTDVKVQLASEESRRGPNIVLSRRVLPWHDAPGGACAFPAPLPLTCDTSPTCR